MARRRSTPKSDAPEEDPKAKDIREKYQKGLNAVRNEINNYWQNDAFLEGDQWLVVNPVTYELDHLREDPDRAQPVMDRLAAGTRTVRAKALQRDLTFEVMPNASDDATRIAAGIAQARVEELHEEHEWEKVRAKAFNAAWKGGTGVILIDWDASKGDPVAPDEDGEPGGTKSGETVETALAITQWVSEPGVEDAERAQWGIKALSLPPETVKTMFNLDYTPDADITTTSGLMTKLVKGAQDAADVDLTLVLTYYERPTGKNKGEITSIVGSRTVDGPKPWPYPFKDRLPIKVIRETMVEHRWAGETVLSLARSVQVALNAAWASAIEHMREAGISRLAVPQSAIDLLDYLTDVPGSFLPYPDGLQPPTYLNPGEMSQTTVKLIEMLPNVIDDILGVHQISRGDAPPNIESGYGLSVLAEQDETPIGHLIKEMAQAFSGIASMVLEIEQARVKHTKKTVVRAPGMPAQITEWKGSDLMGQTDVIVPVGSILPQSRASMQALADKMVQMGLIKSIQQYSKVADLANQRDLISAVSPDVDRARRENYMMTQNVVSKPEAFDNHQIHLDEHLAFMKSAKWETLPEETRKLFLTHNQAHETLAAEAMGRQRAKMGVDPMLAASPDRAGAPTVPVADLPPGGGVPADAGLAPGSSGVGPLNDLAVREMAKGALDDEIALPQ